MSTNAIVMNNTQLNNTAFLKEQVKMMSVIKCKADDYVFTQGKPPFYV